MSEKQLGVFESEEMAKLQLTIKANNKAYADLEARLAASERENRVLKRALGRDLSGYVAWRNDRNCYSAPDGSPLWTEGEAALAYAIAENEEGSDDV